MYKANTERQSYGTPVSMLTYLFASFLRSSRVIFSSLSLSIPLNILLASLSSTKWAPFKLIRSISTIWWSLIYLLELLPSDESCIVWVHLPESMFNPVLILGTDRSSSTTAKLFLSSLLTWSLRSGLHAHPHLARSLLRSLLYLVTDGWPINKICLDSKIKEILSGYQTIPITQRQSSSFIKLNLKQKAK